MNPRLLQVSALLMIILLVATGSSFSQTEEWRVTYDSSRGAPPNIYFAQDIGRQIGFDAAFNIYVVATSVPWTHPTSCDYTIFKYDSFGNQEWHISTGPEPFLSGLPKDFHVDPQGNAYLIFDYLTSENQTDAGIVKTNGSTGWMIRWNNSITNEADSAVAMDVDKSGNVYVLVRSASGSGSRHAAVILKYDPSGNLLWEVHGSTSLPHPRDIDLDGDGNAYVLLDGKIMRHSSIDGELLCSGDVEYWWDDDGLPNNPTYWTDAEGVTIEVAQDGSVYVAGAAEQRHWSWDGSNWESADLDNFFTAKYDSGCNLLWSDQYGAYEDEDYPVALVVDDQEGIVVTGISGDEWGYSHLATLKYSPIGTRAGTFVYSNSEAGDFHIDGEYAYVIELSPLALHKYAMSTGSEEWNIPLDAPIIKAEDVAVDPSGNMYLAGSVDDVWDHEPVTSAYRDDMVLIKYSPGAGLDTDGDGVPDSSDNCPTVANGLNEAAAAGVGDQTDTDGDGLGEACDQWPNDPQNDRDGDDIAGHDDNCPSGHNPGQEDTDGDGSGDACDSDADGDGLLNYPDDNCWKTINPDQTDSDSDRVGDACDNCPDSRNAQWGGCPNFVTCGYAGTCVETDTPYWKPEELYGQVDPYAYTYSCTSQMPCPQRPDGSYWRCTHNQEDADLDGFGDACDNCINHPNDQADADGDGLGDLCDRCPQNSSPDQQEDTDGDGVGDLCDNCKLTPNAAQSDTDSDRLGDACDGWPSDPDNDTDVDGISGGVDNCPVWPNSLQGDLDADGSGDACDCDDLIRGDYEDGRDCGGPCPSCIQCNLSTLPGRFDWRDLVDLPLIRNQANCGSCWAHAAVAAAEGSAIVKHRQDAATFNLSEQNLVSNCGASGSCTGGWHNEALEFIRDGGIVDDNCFPYASQNCLDPNSNCLAACDCEGFCSSPCNCQLCAGSAQRYWSVGKFRRIPDTRSEIKKELLCAGPLAASSNAWSHAFAIVGYDDNNADCLAQYGRAGCWIIRNSHGTTGGNSWRNYDVDGRTISVWHFADGYALIPYTGHACSDLNEKVYKVGGTGELFDLNFGQADGLTGGDVNGDGVAEIIHGDRSDWIRIFDKDGNLLQEFAFDFAEGDGFAAGDVDGDGRAEILHGDQQGWIQILDMNGTLLRRFHQEFAAGDGFTAGDVNGDGIAEIIHGSWEYNAVWVFDVNGDPLKWFSLDFQAEDGLAAGDVNGDRIAEIIHGDRNDLIRIFDKDGGLLSSFAMDFEGGDALTAADVYGNGRAEIIHGDRNEWVNILGMNGNLLRRFGQDFERGDALTAADVDGDGRAEIVHGDYGRDGSSFGRGIRVYN